MKIVYPAKFEADEDGRILVTFRDLPEAATDGADVHEARGEAADLLDSALMFRMKYREGIPAPSKARKGEKLVAPDTAVALKVSLYIAMRESGMTTAELSRRLGVDYREALENQPPRPGAGGVLESGCPAATPNLRIGEIEPLSG